jgi:hypothetical protein
MLIANIYGEMAIDFGEMDNSAKRIWQNVPSVKCPFGEMSLQQNVHSAKWLQRNVLW